MPGRPYSLCADKSECSFPRKEGLGSLFAMWNLTTQLVSGVTLVSA
uniref:Uncharacterized protein n=1 Tax=Mus musculus TaxID=10090 RepID=Q3UHE8_MOUSE|nr:unnamed protein product [Mus musculus]